MECVGVVSHLTSPQERRRNIASGTEASQIHHDPYRERDLLHAGCRMKQVPPDNRRICSFVCFGSCLRSGICSGYVNSNTSNWHEVVLWSSAIHHRETLLLLPNLGRSCTLTERKTHVRPEWLFHSLYPFQDGRSADVLHVLQELQAPKVYLFTSSLNFITDYTTGAIKQYKRRPRKYATTRPCSIRASGRQ